jgi:hypothetical protein
MTIKKYTDDEVLTAAELNGSFSSALRLQSLNSIQLLENHTMDMAPNSGSFTEYYDAATGKEDSVIADRTSATFDTNKYTSSVGPFVIIEATSVDEAAFLINNCLIAQVSTGKWQLSSSSADEEVQRAEIYQTLFSGSSNTGTDARASSTYITGITALKTSVARDVGKQAHFATNDSDSTASGGATGTYTGTFANTSTNTDCSSWSYVSTSGSASIARWENPSGTTLNTQTAASTDEFGVDTSADETDNPATCELQNVSSTSSSRAFGLRAMVLCVGDVTWAYAETGAFNEAVSNIDFFTDNGIPLFTATTESYNVVVYSTIDAGTMGKTMTACYALARQIKTETLGTVTHEVQSRKQLGTNKEQNLTDIRDLTFKSDGTEVYLVDNNGDLLLWYTLSTAFDLRTATFSGKLDVSSQDAIPTGVAIKSDGTQIYMLGGTSDDVFAYDLTTAYDINSGSYSGDSFSCTTQASQARGLFFKPDGTEMYVADIDGATIEQYTLSTGWLVTSASTTNSESLIAETNSPRGVTFNSDGTVMVVMAQSGTYALTLLQYTLSSAYDISTSTFDTSVDMSNYIAEGQGIDFAPGDDNKLYFVSQHVAGIMQIDLTTASDIGGTISINPLVETTGSIADGEVVSFTAFTGNPTNIITTLTPTTNGTLSIDGVVLIGDKP